MSNILLKKSAFIHIPKCGGTFLQSLFFKLCLVEKQYMEPQYGHLYLHQMNDVNDKYFFSFVRHPYTWWPSYYNWCKKDRFIDVERACPNFDVWLKEYGPFWMGQYTRMVQRYIGEDPIYCCNKKINFVGKIEKIYDDTFFALKESGEKFDEPEFLQCVHRVINGPKAKKHLNRQEYDRDISDESKEFIYNSEKYIFDRFGYSKNGDIQ